MVPNIDDCGKIISHTDVVVLNLSIPCTGTITQYVNIILLYKVIFSTVIIVLCLPCNSVIDCTQRVLIDILSVLCTLIKIVHVV